MKHRLLISPLLSQFGRAKYINSRGFKVLFCGRGHFQSGYDYSKDALRNYENIDVVDCNIDDIGREILDTDVIIPLMTRIDDKLMRLAPKLKLIMQFGVGLEGVDVPEATKRKIWVSKIPSGDTGNAASCAEHSIFLALNLLRDHSGMRNSLKSGRLGFPTGKTLLGSKSLIYGYGDIGKKLAILLNAFGSKVVAVKRRFNMTVPTSEIVELAGPDDFSRLVADADLVFMCCNQDATNVGIVNDEFLRKLKRGTFLINVARVSN